jgi:hypothetical protein
MAGSPTPNRNVYGRDPQRPLGRPDGTYRPAGGLARFPPF